MPSLSNSEVKAKVIVDGDTKGVDEAEKKIAGFGERAVNNSKAIAAGLAVAGAAAVALGKMSFDAFTAQEDANTRLLQGMKNVTDDSDEAAGALKRLGDQASQLQGVTRFADEQIISGQAMLTTFKLSEKSISQLTPSMLDMAEAMRKTTGETVDLNQLGIMFGKVMGNAEGGVEGLASGLKKMGVIMTEEQAAVFKYGTEAERAAMLTQIMDDNFKGFAEAGGSTAAGKLEIMKNQIGEVQEKIGGMIANALGPLVEKITTGVVPAFDSFMQFMEKNSALIPIIAGTILALLIPAVVSMGIAFILALSPVTIIIALIGAAIALLYLAWNNNFLGIKTITQSVVNWVTQVAWPGIKSFFDNIGKFLTTLKTTWTNIWEGIKTTTANVISGIIQGVKNMVNGIINGINALIRGVNKVGGKIPGMPQNLIGEIPNFASGVRNFGGGLAVVGEQGPELVNLPRGSDVIPNGQAGGITQNNYIYTGVDLDMAARDLAFALATR